MTRIWHHGAWNRNLGDWVLHESIQHHLSRTTRRKVSFTSVDSQKTCYDRKKIEELNDTADLLLIGGGGLVFHRPEDRSVSGWQWNIRQEDLRRIRVPIAVYGVGYNRFPYDRNSDTARLAAHLCEVQDRAAIFSVRNTGSRSALASLGLSPGRIRVVPDAGIFAPWNNWSEASEIPGDGPLIGWNFSGDRPRHRYPEPHLELEATCVERVALALRELCRNHGARVLLIPHLRTIDERYDALISQIIGSDHVYRLPELTPSVFPARAESSRAFVGAYAACDLVVGMRGHACMIPFGLGKPFVALSTHAKTDFFLKDQSLMRLSVSPEQIWSGALSPSELAMKLHGLIDNRPLAAALAQNRRALLKEFDQLNRDVLRVAQASGIPLRETQVAYSQR